MYKQNKDFEFYIYRENFLSPEQCKKYINLIDSQETQTGKLVGTGKDYENPNVRLTQNIEFEDDKLQSKISMVLELANLKHYKYKVNSLDKLRLLKYGVGGRYEWHTDLGSGDYSNRKLTAIVQLSNEQDYEGGDLEFGLTQEDGSLIKGNRKQGTILVFPSFLSHRISPLTKGKRYSILTWLEGDTFE